MEPEKNICCKNKVKNPDECSDTDKKCECKAEGELIKTQKKAVKVITGVP